MSIKPQCFYFRHENFGQQKTIYLPKSIKKQKLSQPKQSMYGILPYIYHKKSTIHVGKYTSPMGWYVRR